MCKILLTLLLFGIAQILARDSIVPLIIEGAPDYVKLNTEPFEKIGEGYYFVEKHEKLNWYSAFLKCRELDAQLISFETDAEWQNITNYLTSSNDRKWYWTSATDQSHEGNFYWFSTGRPVSLAKYASGQPDNYHNKENCLHMGWWDDKLNNALDDRPCEQEFYYICEANAIRTVSITLW